MEKIRSILITGTSTGIGRACALKLDKEGFQVFAGVRRKSDGEALKKSSTGKLMPLIIDVTDMKTIENAFKIISKLTNGELYGLMNNAGVGGGGPLEITPMSIIRNAVETNLLGNFSVTRTFIPLLRKSRGRIVNTASIFGLSALPGFSAYSATKFGVEAISQSLRLELRAFGITVSAIEPGAIATEIWPKARKTSEEIFSGSDPEIYSLYSKMIQHFRKTVAEQKYLQPETVAECVYHVFTSNNPKRHYIIGKDAKFMAFIESLPEGIRDWLFYKMIHK
ncbi:MAG: short-chain dehydrogenase/reductase [Spirochaetae bacterium HGW-Spirochaetae-5]|nr:MAG: short-chain dehydrogenase/reductase [Spirochaetae bacterium HGW-Spirochaetae-5]